MQKFKKIDQYQLMQTIGKGANGLVYKGLNMTNGSLVAIKEIFIGKSEAKAIKTQLQLLKKLDHPYIVKFIDAIQKQNRIYLILQYMQGGSLASLVRKSPIQEDVTKIYIKQILNGLVFLHKQQVIHRDIKGANILLTKSGLVKLADFGVAVKLQDNQKTISASGSPYWMAPQVISSVGQQPSVKCDIWSLGCTVIQLLTGNPPYYDLMQFPALFRIVEDEHPPIPQCSTQCRQFLMSCFIKDPRKRSSAQQLLALPWMKNAKQSLIKVEQQDQVLINQINKALKQKVNYTALQKILKSTKKGMLICNSKYFQAIALDNNDKGKNFSRLKLMVNLIKIDNMTVFPLCKYEIISQQLNKLGNTDLEDQTINLYYEILLNVPQIYQNEIKTIEIHNNPVDYEILLQIDKLERTIAKNFPSAISKLSTLLCIKTELCKSIKLFESLLNFIESVGVRKKYQDALNLKVQILIEFQRSRQLKRLLKLDFDSQDQFQISFNTKKLEFILKMAQPLNVLAQIDNKYRNQLRYIIKQIIFGGLSNVSKTNEALLMIKFLIVQEIAQSQFSKYQLEQNGFIYHLSAYYQSLISQEKISLSILFEAVLGSLKFIENQKKGVDRNRLMQMHRHGVPQKAKRVYKKFGEQKNKIEKNGLWQKMETLIKMLQNFCK